MALRNKNLWATIRELILEEYRRDNTANISGTLPEGAVNRFQGLLKTLVDELVQPLDDAAVALQNIASIVDAQGSMLDILGMLAGLVREPGESDASFRERIVEEFGKRDAGTPGRVIKTATTLSSDPVPQYMDEAPATYFVYTPGGTQLSLSQLRGQSPAGVLGLPGATVLMGDGSFLADADGRLILMVADDGDTPLPVGHILTELTEPLVSETGDNLVTE